MEERKIHPLYNIPFYGSSNITGSFLFFTPERKTEGKKSTKGHYEKKTILDQNQIKRQMIEWMEESRNDQGEEKETQ